MTKASLGQNFLVNRNIAEKIVRRFLPVSGPIVEIGPGKGVVTDLLVRYRDQNPIIAVELDNSLFYKLKNNYAQTDGFTILNRDILKIELARILPDAETAAATKPGNVNVIGNVPYYISKEIIDWVIRHHQYIGTGVFMMQKEFTDKLKPLPGKLQSNAQSVIMNHLFRMEKLFDVQPGSFSPQPKVKSTVFQLKRIPETLVDLDVHEFYIFLQQCFKNRRKTLMNNIPAATDRESLWELFESHPFNPRLRAEQLSLAEFLKIFRHLTRPGEGF